VIAVDPQVRAVDSTYGGPLDAQQDRQVTIAARWPRERSATAGPRDSQPNDGPDGMSPRGPMDGSMRGGPA